MKKLKHLPAFKSDKDIAAFMEEHDGFELVDLGLADIVGPLHERAQRGSWEDVVDILAKVPDVEPEAHDTL
jgi:hypothetical protein